MVSSCPDDVLSLNTSAQHPELVRMLCIRMQVTAASRHYSTGMLQFASIAHIKLSYHKRKLLRT